MNENKYLKTLQDIAKKNGGKLLSSEWKGSNYKYLFIFSDGRKFEAKPNQIKRNWPKNIELYFKLSKARKKSAKDFLVEMKEIAKNRGGKLISNKWIGVDCKYDFLDEYNNKFSCSYRHLKRGNWSKDRGLVIEPICRQILEFVFGKSFIKTRKILNSKITNDSNWELDGYCEDLKIAFEYQGHPSHWDIKNKEYKEVSKRDELKKNICNKLNIDLIVIPKLSNTDLESNLIFNKILSIINKSCNYEKLLNIKTEGFIINFRKINHSCEMLKELEVIAKENDAKLLTKEWKGAKNKYVFLDKCGNEFSIIADNLKRNGWPKNLSNLKNKDFFLEKLKMIAKENDVELLTKEWKGSKSKYLFKLKNGVEFEKTYDKIKNNILKKS